MIERHVSFEVLPDRSADFERFFVDVYLPPVRAMPGLAECQLLRETERPNNYQMVFRWATAEDATAWRTSAAHQALQPALNELHRGMTVVAYTRVA